MSFIKGRFDNRIARAARFAAPLAVALCAALIWAALAPSTAFAQQSQPTSSPEANLPFLFAVYIITWAAFFAYAFYVSRRRREMQGEIEALKRALEDRERRDAEEENAAKLR